MVTGWPVDLKKGKIGDGTPDKSATKLHISYDTCLVDTLKKALPLKML